MIQYTLYTEDRNIFAIRELTSRLFGSATLYFGQGIWHGLPEASLTIVLLGDEQSRSKVEELARAIKEHNQQEAVYTVSQPITLTVI